VAAGDDAGLYRPDRDFFLASSLEVAPQLLGGVLRHDTPEGTVGLRITEVEAYVGDGIDPGSHAFRGRTKRNAVMYGPPGHLYAYFTYGMHVCANVVCSPEGEATAVLLRGAEVVEGAELALARRSGEIAVGGSARASAWGETGGSAPGRAAGRAPGQAAGQSAGRAPGQGGSVPGQAAGGVPGQVGSVPGQAAGRVPGQAPAQAPEGAPGRLRVVAARDLGRGPARLVVAAGISLEENGADLLAAPFSLQLPRIPRPYVAGPRTGISGAGGSESYPWRFWLPDDPTVSPYKRHPKSH
jgi:DNA-3-methyladenine glycosylase